MRQMADNLPGTHAVTAEVHFIEEIFQLIGSVVFEPIHDQLTTTTAPASEYQSVLHNSIDTTHQHQHHTSFCSTAPFE